MADSCQCMTKPTAMLWNGWPPTNKNKWKKKMTKSKSIEGGDIVNKKSQEIL